MSQKIQTTLILVIFCYFFVILYQRAKIDVTTWSQGNPTELGKFGREEISLAQHVNVKEAVGYIAGR